jgi:hypothetical protein
LDKTFQRWCLKTFTADAAGDIDHRSAPSPHTRRLDRLQTGLEKIREFLKNPAQWVFWVFGFFGFFCFFLGFFGFFIHLPRRESS